jgi:4-alpha-glucanotransferase
MKIHFYVRFHTRYGQGLRILGDQPSLGANDPAHARKMEYLDAQHWHLEVEVDRKEIKGGLHYKYILENEDGELVHEWGQDRVLADISKSFSTIECRDTWNHAGEYENVFYTAPFRNVLLPAKSRRSKKSIGDKITHVFRVKAPLLSRHEQLYLSGAGHALGDWSEKKAVPMKKEGNWWTVSLNLSGEDFPLAYKYGFGREDQDGSIQYEAGENRWLHAPSSSEKLVISHDGFIHAPNNTWKGAGVAIPVFSLRSKNSFGVGEFTDIRLLADWARSTGLKVIQLLPVNDTISTNSWEDSYPYSAISAFALHPLYINVFQVAGKEHADSLKPLKKKRMALNAEPVVNYEEVIRYKISVLRELYEVMGEACLSDDDFKKFFLQHEHWLKPYAAFCLLRDKHGTADFNHWPTHAVYDKREVEALCHPGAPGYHDIGFYFFVQYHLHLQLLDAAEYAHRRGVVMKGDIPIGISRHSCDAWMAPELYNMCWQAGAPPDDFTAIGQNWGFPTYNWKRMQEDDFRWWKQRFAQMSDYFDAFRIDHILGFFRIWSIPMHAVQGIFGRFVPCLPVLRKEFDERGIPFDRDRYCQPFVTPEVIDELFGAHAALVKEEFFVTDRQGRLSLDPAFQTQRQVESHFNKEDDTEENRFIRDRLYELIANVILFEDTEGGDEFHFRISIEKTSSYRNLPVDLQQKLYDLYIHYFYRRQDDFWFREAMHKLPRLKAVTNMLVCGEDLGMVPHCVPDVMQQLGILSLEIQRMPKDPQKEFFHPKDAPYLSVITPSTHDMSTIRGWWEENRERTQHFFNTVLGQYGEAPTYCEAWINRAILLQHLYSPAMWSIFQLQDILGMHENLRRENPQEERINNPANPKHYWQYRMHLTLEELIKQKSFNEELKEYVRNSGR